MTKYRRWDYTPLRYPLDEASKLLSEMDRLVGQRLRSPESDEVLHLSVDVYSTENEVVVEAAVPGIEPQDVQISMEGNVLTIKGTLRAPLGNVDYMLQERPYGPFSRSLEIHVPVVVADASASFDKGILTICLPKADEAKARTIHVSGG